MNNSESCDKLYRNMYLDIRFQQKHQHQTAVFPLRWDVVFVFAEHVCNVNVVCPLLRS